MQVAPARDQPRSSASPISFVDEKKKSYLERLSQARINFQRLPDELRAASCSPPPNCNARITLWREKVEELVREAGGDPSSSKWSHLSRLLRLRCTSRGYVGAARTVRVGDVSFKAQAQDFQWKIPETEEEWWECERQWEERKQNVSVPAEINDPSPPSEHPQPDVQQEVLPLDRRTKAAIAKEKVAVWQARMTAEELLVPIDEQLDFEGREATERPQLTKDGLRGSPKMLAQTDVLSNDRIVHEPGVVQGEYLLSPMAVANQDRVPVSKPSSPNGRPYPKITDVSEMRFFPPSFPSQLKTSTPPRGNAVPVDHRIKPPPIIPIPSSSSPVSVPPRSPILFMDVPKFSGQLASPSSLEDTPTRKPGKRVSDNTHTSALYPLAKKRRSEVEEHPNLPNEHKQMSSPGFNFPLQLPHTKSNGRNRQGEHGNSPLPVPVTPEKQKLPTLTELMASRRSRARTRTPTHRPSPSNVQQGRGADGNDKDGIRRAITSPSPSGSTKTPGPHRHHHLHDAGHDAEHSMPSSSPIAALPLFSRALDTFAPPFISSQRAAFRTDSGTTTTRNGNGGGGGFLGVGYESRSTDQDHQKQQQQHHSQNSAGVFGLGYSSQFDVEDHVGHVADFLEKDVDYGGWLRDIPEEEEPVHLSSQSKSQS